MSHDEFLKTLDELGLPISSWHGGAGKFRDLYIGTGLSHARLVNAKQTLEQRGLKCLMRISHISNSDHEDYGKLMLEVQSYWWDEPANV